jgi:formiminotetrahydrofolate cyclodeaminase
MSTEEDTKNLKTEIDSDNMTWDKKLETYKLETESDGVEAARQTKLFIF